jgi:hypothetical protein
VNQLDCKRHTALFYAKKFNKESSVKILLDNGAEDVTEAPNPQPKLVPTQKRKQKIKKKLKLSLTDKIYNLVYVNKKG